VFFTIFCRDFLQTLSINNTRSIHQLQQPIS